MNFRETLSKLNKISGDKRSISYICKGILSFSGGIIFSLPCFLGSFSPFVAALPAAVNLNLSAVCAAGAILGIFVFQSGMTAFRYFATVLTSTAILNICLFYLGFKNERTLRRLCPGICSFIVNAAFLISQKFSPELTVSLFAETALCVISVDVFSKGIDRVFSKDKENLWDISTLIPTIVTLSVAVSQLRWFGEGGKALSLFFFLCAVLFFAFKKMPFPCAVTSCSAGIVTAFNGEADFLCVCLAFCGIICPVIKAGDRFRVSLTAVCICLMGCFFGEYTDFLPSFIAVIASVATMLLIPSRFVEPEIPHTSQSFSDTIAVPVRAREISAAVENLGDCINAVRKTLVPLTRPELKEVIFNACKKVCDTCELNESCINSIRKPNDAHYQKIASALEENRLDFSSFPENFIKTCYMNEKVMNAVRQAYFVYCTNINSENKINRFQQITGNQLKNIGSIIAPICSTAINAGAVTSQSSRACAVCAENFGISVRQARLCTDKAGHEYFNLSFDKPDENFNVTRLTENLRRETGFELDFPTLVQKDDVYTLIFKQKPKVNFKIAAAVRSASADGVSGDYYRSFTDSFSRQIILLSDGMGTGTRAAVDSAFTCETFCNLLKSGLDVKTAASAVNCAMLMKSTDESLSTVDLVIADPVLCRLTIYKCGAAPSFILKNGKTSVLEAESAPIGILDKIDMSKSEISVSKGDIYLTVSDGITADSWGWIASELKSFQGSSPSALAKHILQCALDRRLGKKADDMTVIALITE